MNSKIVSTLLATAGVALGVIGITTGAASSTPADCPTVPSLSAPAAASGAADGATAAVPATAVLGTHTATPVVAIPSATEGNGGRTSAAGDGNGDGSLVDVTVHPPSGTTTPTLPAGDLGDLGGLVVELDAHADQTQSGHPLVAASGSADHR